MQDSEAVPMLHAPRICMYASPKFVGGPNSLHQIAPDWCEFFAPDCARLLRAWAGATHVHMRVYVYPYVHAHTCPCFYIYRSCEGALEADSSTAPAAFALCMQLWGANSQQPDGLAAGSAAAAVLRQAID